MLHGFAIAVHVVVAVLAVGLVGAIPLTARLARRFAGQLPAAEGILGALVRSVQLGLFVMLLTGVVLDFSVAGGYHRMAWFRASIAVLVFLGFCLGRARAALRTHELGRVEAWGWAVCASVAVITTLMQLKPLL